MRRDTAKSDFRFYLSQLQHPVKRTGKVNTHQFRQYFVLIGPYNFHSTTRLLHS